MVTPITPKKCCLIVIDGWGVSLASNTDSCIGDAIRNAKTPNMAKLKGSYFYSELVAHGRAVGLPAGLMGNSEVGHLNIGAGRVVYQDIVRIDLAVENGNLEKSSELQQAFEGAKSGNGRLHFVGLVSDGGVHSHLSHLKALLGYAKHAQVPETFVHAITDGRDTAPTSAVGYIGDLLGFLHDMKCGVLATVMGRYYAMDRDNRWERTKIAHDALTAGTGTVVPEKDLLGAIETRYNVDVPERDEFLKPIITCPTGRIQDGDSIIFFNFRSDRMRQLVSCLGLDQDQPRFEAKAIPRNLKITCMTRYSATFPFPVLSPPQQLDNVLAEHLSKLGIKQFHTAETEKYAHVTFFFNGGREMQFDGEERRLVASPKVSTYDLKPEMSVAEVADSVIEAVASNEYPFVMCNFAPPDMVGHTGKYEPTVRAVEATDAAIGRVFEACTVHDVTLVITSDHGNAEKMISESGGEHTAHTCAPVPLIITRKDLGSKISSLERSPALCDVAPTILDLLGMPKPAEMTGESLVCNRLG